MNRIRIAAFDQIPLFRAGIVQTLNAELGMVVVGEGSSVSEAVCVSAQLVPDVVILDANLLEAGPTPSQSLIELCSRSKVLLLTFIADREKAQTAFAAGVRGYVLKAVSGRELLEAVRAIHQNEGYVSPAIAAVMMQNQAIANTGNGDAERRSLARLTHREAQIFQLLSAGLTNKEIGTNLDLSEKSIKRYVTRIFEKLHVRNRVEAAMLCAAGSKSTSLASPAATVPALSSPICRRNEISRMTKSAIPSSVSDIAGACTPRPQEGSLVRTIVSKRGLLVANHPTQGAPDEGVLAPVRIGSSSERCFYAVFGRHLLAVRGIAEDSRNMPLGTHILL